MSITSNPIGPVNNEKTQPASSVLSLSANSLYLPTKLSFQYIELSWDFPSATNQLDWIGLFASDECNPLLYLDYKHFRIRGKQESTVMWKITQELMPPQVERAQLRFRYYSGLTGTVLASSPSFLVYKNGQVVLTSIKCKNLRPSKHAYLIKVYYGNEVFYKTELSNNGVWSDLNFSFPADLSQELLLVVREKQWNGSKVIGEANIKIAEMVQKSGELAFVLRTKSNIQFNTQISIQWYFIPKESPTETNSMSSKKLLAKRSDALNGNVPSASGGYPSSTSSFYSNGNGNSDALSVDSRSITKLPEGWEIRVDKSGRLLYVDHIHKQTTWNPPMILEREQSHIGSARRTVFSSSEINNKNESTSQVVLNFLQHSDFPSMLYQNAEALKVYNESPYLKHIISRLRKNKALDQFERNRELVTFLNLFTDVTQPLPLNWEVARCTDSTNQRLFIDHKNKKITAIDPRLPLRHALDRQTKENLRVQNEPSTIPLLDINSNLRWGTEEIGHRIQQEMPELAPQICRKLRQIRVLGESALERYSNDIEFVSAISAIEHQAQMMRVTSTDLDIKIDYFYNALQRGGYGQGSEKIRLNLRRSHLLSDAFDKLLNADPLSLRRCQLVVIFDGEEGLDFGGVSKEMFYLLSRELFNPYYGLFEYSANDTYSVEISPMSKFVDHSFQWFSLCGRILGLALLNRCLIDTFFTKAFYKMLIGVAYSLEDLKMMDSQFYNSLKWIRENPINSDMNLTFNTTTDVGGEIIETELLPGGKAIMVSDQNKEQFVSLMVRFRIERNIGDQMKALKKGLYDIIPRDYLCVFDADQLGILLSGTLEIDLEDWKRHTEYKGGYRPDHIVIKWFWETVFEMSNAERLKLLQFVTGTQSIPVQGFGSLRGSNGTLKLFTIERWGNIESLPRAHSCFNRLDLPSYVSRDCLKQKLRMAINESSTYGLE